MFSLTQWPRDNKKNLKDKVQDKLRLPAGDLVEVGGQDDEAVLGQQMR